MVLLDLWHEKEDYGCREQTQTATDPEGTRSLRGAGGERIDDLRES